MRDIPERCPRCGQKPLASIMSRFNQEIICSQCERIERLHPAYAAAAAVELAAVRRGDYNFPGVGAPADIVEFTRQRRGLG
jgi:hypothetical protein